MRFVSDLYEHPDLTDSEVWDNDTNNRPATRVVAAMSVLSLATITSVVAAVQYVRYESLLKVAGLNDNSLSALRLWFIRGS